MIFNRDKRSAVTAEDVTADPAVPDSPAVPVDLAAADEQIRREAADARERARQGRADDEARVTAVREEATRMVAEAEAGRAEAERRHAADDRLAAALDQRGQRLAHAADLETRAGTPNGRLTLWPMNETGSTRR